MDRSQTTAQKGYLFYSNRRGQKVNKSAVVTGLSMPRGINVTKLSVSLV